MLRIAVVLGSTRPNRVGETVADWVLDVAGKRTDAKYELIDVAGLGLPLLDEPLPPSLGQYANQHTRDWAARVAAFDGFVFVVPEYNHSVSAGLKNAIDFLYAEWNDKVAGFVSYGASGGVRAVEHLRVIMAGLQIATVRAQVALNSYLDFEDFYDFKPSERHAEALHVVLDQVTSWGAALRTVRGGGCSCDADVTSGPPER